MFPGSSFWCCQFKQSTDVDVRGTEELFVRKLIVAQIDQELLRMLSRRELDE
jgi:hypothetical protein